MDVYIHIFCFNSLGDIIHMLLYYLTTVSYCWKNVHTLIIYLAIIRVIIYFIFEYNRSYFNQR